MRLIVYLLPFLFTSSFAQNNDSIALKIENPRKPIMLNQQEQNLYPKNGTLEEYTDAKIFQLIEEYNSEKIIKGFKIQLFAGNSKIEAKNIKANCLNYYRDVIPEIIYQSPNFKVRVGNYRDRLEANRALNNFKNHFPTAFIVQDEITVDSFFKDKKN